MSGSTSLCGVIIDLSRRALFFQSQGTLELGASCSVYPSDDPRIELRGRVLHIIYKGPGGRRGLGVALHGLDVRARAWIEEVLE